MNSRIKINQNSQTPVYKQLMYTITNLIELNHYKEGDILPSLNELSKELDASKETVKKAYSHLRDAGLISSEQGKGFYVTNQKDRKKKILILLHKVSTYKQVALSSFTENLKVNSEITIRLHNHDIDLFNKLIVENLDNYDFYIVAPHFPLDFTTQKRVRTIIKKIPNRKLILIDKHIEELSGNFGSVYQDFETDVAFGLTQGLEQLKKYKKLNIFTMPSSLYAPLIKKGIIKFCKNNNILFQFHKKLDKKKIEPNEIYLFLSGQIDTEFVNFIKEVKNLNLKIGKDIGIIGYNESPVNEIILNGLTVLSTDNKQMGKLAAEMINHNTKEKIKCNFQLFRRNTF